MNMEGLIEAFSCHLNMKHGAMNGNGHSNHHKEAVHQQRKHFLENPKIFPCCRQTACNKCIVKHSKTTPSSRRTSGSSYDLEVCIFDCPFCGSKFKFNLNIHTNESDLETNEKAIDEYERNLIEINHYLVKKLEISVKNIEGMPFCLFKSGFITKLEG
jgi:hypothetical protein